MANSSLYTREEQISDISARRPHLVILGAGASLAACPLGDATGKKLPLMTNLVETLELTDLLDTANVHHEGRNFEDVYSQIASNLTLKELQHTIEDRVAEYFNKLRLPEEPTIYDYLVLSLRPKDAIATFNWDPFLYQALERNSNYTTLLPQFFFLHGSAIVGYCKKDKRQGKLWGKCHICGNSFIPTRLLYPVTEKDYTYDPYISSQWEAVRAFLKGSFLLTIFGYSAPKTDTAAIDFMSKAWGTPEERRFEEIEIVDVKSENELYETWKRFIHTHHYQVKSDYFKSILAMHPRRSVEAYWQSLLMARWREENWVPRVKTLTELWEWFNDLINEEEG